MLESINELPLLTAATVICGICVGLTFAGVSFLRPVVRALVGKHSSINTVVGGFLGVFGVLYGILMGLLAVSAYENKVSLQELANTEATALFSLYRNASAFPEPTRSELRGAFTDYAAAVIDEEWPEMRRGDVADAAMRDADRAQAALARFEPTRVGEEVLLAEVSTRFYDFLELRGKRVTGALRRLPRIMWVAVLLGAAINIVSFWLFDTKLGVQLLLTGLLAFYIGVVITLIAVLDSPVRGDHGIEPTSFELLQDYVQRTEDE